MNMQFRARKLLNGYEGFDSTPGNYNTFKWPRKHWKIWQHQLECIILFKLTCSCWNTWNLDAIKPLVLVSDHVKHAQTQLDKQGQKLPLDALLIDQTPRPDLHSIAFPIPHISSAPYLITWHPVSYPVSFEGVWSQSSFVVFSSAQCCIKKRNG